VRAVLATEPVRPEVENEDFAAVMPAAAVLLDGAGTPPGLESGCIHGVAWFARTLGTTLLARILAAAGSLADCLYDAMSDVRSRHDGQCDLSHEGSPSATVVAIRIAGGRLEHLVLSDSALVLVDQAGASRVVSDQRIEEAARPYRGPVNRLPIGTPAHAVAFADYVRTVRGLKNTEAGYWVASADPEAARHALTGSTPLAGLRAALLLSDGATRLTDLFELASWDELAALVIESGPAELIRRVRVAEASDPDGERWKRGKAVDDATAVCCDELAP
jgi:Protein phosphatase 2C